MALDGWTLDKKIDKLRNEIVGEINELKLHFSTLYEYMKSMDEVSDKKGDKKDASKRKRKSPTLHN